MLEGLVKTPAMEWHIKVLIALVGLFRYAASWITLRQAQDDNVSVGSSELDLQRIKVIHTMVLIPFWLVENQCCSDR